MHSTSFVSSQKSCPCLSRLSRWSSPSATLSNSTSITKTRKQSQTSLKILQKLVTKARKLPPLNQLSNRLRWILINSNMHWFGLPSLAKSYLEVRAKNRNSARPNLTRCGVRPSKRRKSSWKIVRSSEPVSRTRPYRRCGKNIHTSRSRYKQRWASHHLSVLKRFRVTVSWYRKVPLMDQKQTFQPLVKRSSRDG